MVEKYIDRYNTTRLHSANSHIAPADKLAANDRELFKERYRELRMQKRQRAFPQTNHSGKAGLPLKQTA